jgi:hypothetical protein
MIRNGTKVRFGQLPFAGIERRHRNAGMVAHPLQRTRRRYGLDANERTPGFNPALELVWLRLNYCGSDAILQIAAENRAAIV